MYLAGNQIQEACIKIADQPGNECRNANVGLGNINNYVHYKIVIYGAFVP